MTSRTTKSKSAPQANSARSKKTAPAPRQKAAPETTLDKNEYAALLRRIQKLLTESDTASGVAKLGAYWQIGQIINDARLSRKAGYHNTVLRDLAADTHVSVRNLQHALAFRDAYEKPPTQSGLVWSHYRVLLRLADPKERTFYERLAIEKQWDTRALEGALGTGLYLAEPAKKPRLERPTDPGFLFPATILQVLDADTLEIQVDLGFSTFGIHKLRLVQIDAPELDTAPGRAAKSFLASHLVAAQTLVVKTQKTDLHGRYVAHVFTTTHKTTIADCFANGVHVNDLLLRKKFAKMVVG